MQTQSAKIGHEPVRHRVERRLHIERHQQAARVRQHHRSVQQGLAIGDVTKAPYPADHFLSEALRQRAALVDAAVLERNMSKLSASGKA